MILMPQYVLNIGSFTHHMYLIALSICQIILEHNDFLNVCSWLV